MNREKIATYRDGITMDDMKAGDLIYLTKNVRGFQHVIECSFIGCRRNIVRASVIRPIEPNAEELDSRYPKDTILTARKNRCFLWGKSSRNPDITWPCCQWFK